MTPRLLRGTDRRQQSGPHEIPGHAHHFARSRSEMKSVGKSAQEAAAEKPFADLEPVWGKGIINGDSGSTSSICRSESPAEYFLTSNP